MDLDPAHGLDALRTWLATSDDAPRRATFVAEVRAAGPLTLGFVWVGPPDDAAPLVARARPPGHGAGGRVDPAQLRRPAAAVGRRLRVRLPALREEPLRAASCPTRRSRRSSPTPRRTSAAASLVAYGGAIADVDPDATAFAHRGTRFEYDVGAKWVDADDDEHHAATCRRLAATIAPWSIGVYVNALGVEGAEGVHRAYGDATYTRLQQLKTAWDPDNTFRLNQNIPPA